MANEKTSGTQEGTVTRDTEREGVGVMEAHATPTSGMSRKELRESLAYAPDRDLHPAGEPEKQVDKTSAPNALDAELHDPPVRSNQPQAKLLRTLATGAGAHVPPSPDEAHASGRPSYDEAAASRGEALDK